MIAPADHGNISSAPAEVQQVCHHQSTLAHRIKALINAAILTIESSAGSKTWCCSRTTLLAGEHMWQKTLPIHRPQRGGPNEFNRVYRMIY